MLPADSVLLFPMPPKQVAALHGGLVAGVLMRRVGFLWLPQVPPRRLVHVHVLVTTSQRPPATQRPRPNRRALVSSQSLPEPSLALALLEAINPILRNRNGLSPHRPRNPLAVSSCLVCPLLTYAHAHVHSGPSTVSRSNSCPPLCKLYTSKIHIVLLPSP